MASNFAPVASDERILFECADNIAFDYGALPLQDSSEFQPESLASDGELPRIVQIRLVAGGKPRVVSARLQYAR